MKVQAFAVAVIAAVALVGCSKTPPNPNIQACASWETAAKYLDLSATRDVNAAAAGFDAASRQAVGQLSETMYTATQHAKLMGSSNEDSITAEIIALWAVRDGCAAAGRDITYPGSLNN